MEIGCHFIKQSWTNGLKYSCKVSSLKISKLGTVVKSFKGVHEEGKSNYDVADLSITDSNIECFPEGIAKIFPNLTNLNLWKCGLKTIATRDLVEFENLELICLDNNNLKSLPSDLFVALPKVRWIYCCDNKIESLSAKLLEPIRNQLIYVSFARNAKIDAVFDRGSKEKNSMDDFLSQIDQKCTQTLEQSLQSTELVQSRRKKIDEILRSRKFSDFTIRLRDKEFKVHKFMLAAQSSVFASMFSDDVGEGAQAFKNIKNTSEKAFEAFLEYFYTGALQNGDNKMEMFELASEFDVPDLKSICEKMILENPGEFKAIDLFNLGHTYSSEALKKSAFAQIKTIFPEIADKAIDDKQLVNDIFEVKEKLDKLIVTAKDK